MRTRIFLTIVISSFFLGILVTALIPRVITKIYAMETTEMKLLGEVHDTQSAHQTAFLIYCDAPRGNIIYIVAWGSTNAGVGAIHQPEFCK